MLDSRAAPSVADRSSRGSRVDRQGQSRDAARRCGSLSTRVTKLEQENAALEFAAESFGALADRLNTALRAIREIPRS